MRYESRVSSDGDRPAKVHRGTPWQNGTPSVASYSVERPNEEEGEKSIGGAYGPSSAQQGGSQGRSGGDRDAEGKQEQIRVRSKVGCVQVEEGTAGRNGISL